MYQTTILTPQRRAVTRSAHPAAATVRRVPCLTRAASAWLSESLGDDDAADLRDFGRIAARGLA